MNTCCDYGKCTNGPDCPVRQKRLKEINDAYVKGYIMGQENPLDDLADTFKALLTMLTAMLGVWIVCLIFWGK